MPEGSFQQICCRPVSFGNPALGTFEGTVYTVEYAESQPTQQQWLGTVVEQASSVDRTVAMVDVPPDQVPEGIFNVIRPLRPRIRHLRIVVGEPLSVEGSREINETGLETKIDGDGLGKANQGFLFLGEQYRCRNKKDRKYLVLFELESEEAAQEMLEFLHGQPYTSFDETVRCSIYRVVALQGKDGVNLQSPFFDSNGNNNTCQQIVNSTLQPAEGEYNCAVCLDRLNLAPVDGEQSSVLTTVCNHSFHMDCLLKWQDSPCPVCRYDHSGLNDALSQCHICGTTEGSYVCLICGTISCAPVSTGTSFGSGANNNDCATSSMSSSHFTLEQDARIGNNPPTTQGISANSHARKHYDETLHTYALDTATHHVWDFAGQGYVHRLLQNKEDGKLVEVSDPMAHSEERTQNPGLSEDQETQVVHQKLEGMASAYYRQLKSQLEKQRLYYEGQLQEIRHEVRSQKSANDLIAALKQERHQLTQRLALVHRRRNKAKDTVTFLVNMIESLEKNKASFRENVIQAQQERAALQRMFEEALPPLQEKVTRLMLQLEADLTDSNVPTTAPCNDKKKASRKTKS